MAERPTPLAWRAVAGVILVGTPWIGWTAARHRLAGLLVLGLTGAGLASAVPIALASRRPPIPPIRPFPAIPPIPPGDAFRPAAAGRTLFTVVVAGRDEAAVLPRLIRDLALQDHRTPDGQPSFELIVIDDRSTDATAEAAETAAQEAGLAAVTRVVRRRGADLPDGKGAALTAVDPREYRGEFVVVLDADARIEPAFLSTLQHYVTAGARAMTARRRILDAESSWLAGAQGDEQTVDGELQRGRWALGGLSEFRGNGIVVARTVLVDVGGWRAEALTEDLDLSSRVAAAYGTGVAWAIDAEVWEEPVRDWRSLWRQRVRWAEGAVQRLLEHGTAVVASPRVPLRARADFVAYAGQLLAPPLIAGLVAGSVVHGRVGVAAGVAGAYAATAGGLAWDALRWETSVGDGELGVGERAARSIRAALFGSVWLAAVPAALWRLATRRGPVVYDKMSRDGVRA